MRRREVLGKMVEINRVGLEIKGCIKAECGMYLGGRNFLFFGVIFGGLEYFGRFCL